MLESRPRWSSRSDPEEAPSKELGSTGPEATLHSAIELATRSNLLGSPSNFKV